MISLYKNPEAFYLLIMVPFFLLRHLQTLYGDGGTVHHSTGFAMRSRGMIWHHLLFLVKVAAFIFLVIALGSFSNKSVIVQ